MQGSKAEVLSDAANLYNKKCRIRIQCALFEETEWITIKFGILLIYIFDQGRDQLQSYSTLSSIILNKNYPLNFMKVFHILANINPLKLDEKSKGMEITISCILGLAENLDLLYQLLT